MKKLSLILFAVMALGILSCNRTQTPPKEENNQPVASLATYDMVLLEDGKMVFFNNTTQEKSTFITETDRVVNAVYDDNNQLYYTISDVNQQLTLKKLDLNAADPQPQKCVDWQFSLDDIISPFTTQIYPLVWDYKHENILLSKNNPEDFFINDVVAFNLASGQIKQLSYEEQRSLTGNAYCKAMDHFFGEQQSLYYVNEEGKFCLNDNIDFKQAFPGDDTEDLGFMPQSVSPDGSKVVYSAIIYIGEGWGYYCVSSCDGHSQLLLNDSDIWDDAPSWLADGTLLYTSHEVVSPNEVENDNPSCLKTIAPDQAVRVISNAESYAIKPFNTPMNEKVCQETVEEDIDLAILDHGKLTFYNSKTDTYYTLANETDSVVNGAFDNDNAFFYTVAIGDELYFKQFLYGDYTQHPQLRTSWDLKLEECISQTYGKVAPLVLYPDLTIATLAHEFNWDYYGFEGIRLYDYGWGKKREGWDPEEHETDSYDEKFLKWDEDMTKFHSEDNNYYYNDANGDYCISDKIDFKKYVSDPAYFEDPEFEFLSIDPTNKYVMYATIIEYGDLGHGPLCFASLDGKVQLALEDTDAPDMTAGWLSDGSLVYMVGNTIKRVSPNGEISDFYQADGFITKY